MMCDLHVHTVFSDGKNTPEEMVLSAISLGLDMIGFSDHAPTEFCDTDMRDDIGYRSEIERLKPLYADRIKILCGIEQDYYSDESTEEYDYVIGSVHNIKTKDGFFAIDESPEISKMLIEKYFGGDVYSMLEEYFRLVSDIVEKTGANIIGHFDLPTKFNEQICLFDEKNPRYIAAWKKAADNLLKYSIPFEINYGAISRGYRTTPYPSPDIIEYITSHGGKMINGSDSHRAETIGFGFIQKLDW